jgi:hypothetical protein
VTPVASQCRNAFVAGTVTPSAIASCFTNVNSPQFNGASAYSCVGNAPLYCQFNTVCVGSTPTGSQPAPTNAISDGGFESGNLNAWTASSTVGADSVIAVSVSGDQPHTGTYSLKTVFSNTDGGSRTWFQDLQVEPGAAYEVSWWWYSTNSAASTVSRVQISGFGGVSILKDASTLNGPTNTWVQATQNFTTGGTAGRIYLSVFGNEGNAANTFYVDDLTLTRV